MHLGFIIGLSSIECECKCKCNQLKNSRWYCSISRVPTEHGCVENNSKINWSILSWVRSLYWFPHIHQVNRSAFQYSHQDSRWVSVILLRNGLIRPSRFSLKPNEAQGYNSSLQQPSSNTSFSIVPKLSFFDTLILSNYKASVISGATKYNLSEQGLEEGYWNWKWKWEVSRLPSNTMIKFIRVLYLCKSIKTRYFHNAYNIRFTYGAFSAAPLDI